MDKAKKQASTKGVPQVQAKHSRRTSETSNSKKDTTNGSTKESTMIKAISLLLNEIISENEANVDPNLSKIKSKLR
jgi:hypothetical protein